jgi:hypothetical protein
MRLALPPARRGAFESAREHANGAAGTRRFLVGGHFRDFLSRYPEAWLMYAKMMNTHVLVNQVRGDKYKKKAAQNELWKGQSHHAYWNSGSGGIYENELRKAVYRSLIEAEKITRATEIFAPSILSVDYDMDNRIEYLYQGSELNAYIHSLGGALFELDFLPASWNYLDTMIDREGQPEKAPGDSDASRSYEGKAFLDHFFSPGARIDDFQTGALAEAGDFLFSPYEMVELNRALPELLMRRDGTVTMDSRAQPLRVEKRFVFRPRSIDVRHIRGRDQRLPRRTFGGERPPVPAGRGPKEGDLLRRRRHRGSPGTAHPRRAKRSVCHPFIGPGFPVLERPRRDRRAPRVPVPLLRASVELHPCAGRDLGKSPERWIREDAALISIARSAVGRPVSATARGGARSVDAATD